MLLSDRCPFSVLDSIAHLSQWASFGPRLADGATRPSRWPMPAPVGAPRWKADPLAPAVADPLVFRLHHRVMPPRQGRPPMSSPQRAWALAQIHRLFGSSPPFTKDGQLSRTSQNCIGMTPIG